MIYTVDMMRTAVESATRAARDTARLDERERVCRILASYAELSHDWRDRAMWWEAIAAVRAGEAAS